MRSKILDLLREAGDSYLSGEEMAKRLGVSRTAVWKHIQELRRDGYDIVSHSRSGYSLQSAPDTLRPEEIKNGLRTRRIGREIRFYPTVDSTNLEAKRLAQQGAPDGLIVVAEEQGKGRGRLERSFFSPAGKGIWFSVILRPDFLPQEAPKCTLLSAVAVAQAAEDFGMKGGIKWPNDVLADGRKLVGILTEMSAEMERIHYVIIGTGINVNIAEEDFPEDLRDKATSLSQLKGEEIPRAAFFRAVLEHMDALYDSILREGFASRWGRWCASSMRAAARMPLRAGPSTSMRTARCSSIRQRDAGASSRATSPSARSRTETGFYNRRIIFVISSRYRQHEYCHGYL